MPAAEISRIAFRTGEPRQVPTADTPADNYIDLPETGKLIPEANFYLKSLKTETINE